MKKLTPLKVLGLVVLTAILTVLGLNLFSADDKKIRRKVEHRYGVDDPQFIGAMGALLGPPLMPGNRAETLQKGDQIFPAMLAGIRGARRTIAFFQSERWPGRVNT